MFTTSAIVHVIPQPQKIKHETTCLITATVDDGIAEFYRYMTNKTLHIGLLKPSWNAHVTISKINPVIPWQFDKMPVMIQYTPFVRYSGDNPIAEPTPEWQAKVGKFWFLDVWSDDIREIRRKLDLPDYEKFHVTIGVLETPIDASKKLSKWC